MGVLPNCFPLPIENDREVGRKVRNVKAHLPKLVGVKERAGSYRTNIKFNQIAEEEHEKDQEMTVFNFAHLFDQETGTYNESELFCEEGPDIHQAKVPEIEESFCVGDTMVCNLSHLFNNDHVGDTSGTQNGDICQAIDILPFYTENKRARDNGYHKVWHREALWGSSISKISTILLTVMILCLVLVTTRQLGEAYHSPMTPPNYNSRVTAVPPPVEAHGYKVELEKPFVCYVINIHEKS